MLFRLIVLTLGLLCRGSQVNENKHQIAGKVQLNALRN
jgi:hypothetical protein